MSIRYSSEQLQRKFPGSAASPGYARVADALRVEGRLDEAIALCQEGLSARPRVAGYVVLGKALLDAGRMEEAREPFEAALRLDARCLAAMHSLARIMDKLHWADAAAGYCRSILEVEPWDAEIRALLEGMAPGAMPGDAAGAVPGGAHTDAAPLARAEGAFPAGEDTFTKPEGMEGDVLEVNLNDMADEFLPSGGEDPALAAEDPIAAGPAHAPADDFSPAPDPAGEPKPMDILPSASASPAAASGPETLGENAPAPISGSDVEERLDSLFGSEDGGTPSATATWTAAPALSDLPPEASATATGEFRAFEAAPEPASDAPPFDLASPPESADSGADSAFATREQAVPGSAPSEGDETLAADARVEGEDIERRLDELFHLSGDEDKPKPALSASDLPVAPPPRVDEPAALGEPVAFGQRPAAVPEEASLPEGEIVTGQDVADKLDSLFGAEPGTKAPSPASAAPEARFPAEAAPSEPPADETLLSTESMVPSAWSGDAPQVTGADVEAQLDKLFDLEPSAPAAAAGNAGAPEAPAQRAAEDIRPKAAEAVPYGNLDETVTFVPPSPAAAEKASLKESVADWLARQDEASAGDTLILPSEAVSPAEIPGTDKGGDELFGTLAPEDLPALSGTASIEMVDGGDVADRLDKLFADSPSAAAPSEIPLFAPDEPALPEPEIEPEAGATLEVPIPGMPGEEPAQKADSDAAGTASRPTAPELAPMLDEEEGFPEEEEMPAQAAGANVATVTLAEIYFQQGLKEQALQIYRQLLEREPENESVRKRIAEIEASKTEGDSGSGADPRRPRPGLKVPKRKK